MPIALLDNDIILKLAVCDLFWEAMSSLSLERSDLRVLTNAKYVFQKSRRVKQQYPQEIREVAIAIVSECHTIEANPNNELSQLQIEGIDPGEVILISATLSLEFFYLVTGDKRCLQALAREEQVREIYKRLQGKCVCLEQLIFKLIETKGFDRILAKILPALEYDTSLKAIFGSGVQSTEENVVQALQAYIEDLQAKTNGLLIDNL
jgi:hypothetical protein